MAEDRKKHSEQHEHSGDDRGDGHHLPPRPSNGPPLDDTDRNSDKVITPLRSPDRPAGE